ncbi:MAG: hypothetical protein EAZ97_10395 [Bacteroidetes bacterium]|nr:MAG: hypothetical protein EAZ97_10395 [Bacteroidota bacterium]
MKIFVLLLTILLAIITVMALIKPVLLKRIGLNLTRPKIFLIGSLTIFILLIILGRFVNPEEVKYYNAKTLLAEKKYRQAADMLKKIDTKSDLYKESVNLYKEADSLALLYEENLKKEDSENLKLLKAYGKIDASKEIEKVAFDSLNGVAQFTYKLQTPSLSWYWDTNDKIEKAMVSIPARVMKDFDFVNVVELTLPFESKTYYTKISRQEIEAYTRTSFENIKKDFSVNFVDIYVYNKKIGETNKKRKDYFDKFVKIK